MIVEPTDRQGWGAYIGYNGNPAKTLKAARLTLTKLDLLEEVTIEDSTDSPDGWYVCTISMKLFKELLITTQVFESDHLQNGRSTFEIQLADGMEAIVWREG